MPHNPTVLLILDGWGQAPASVGNAVSLAKIPNIDALVGSVPKATLLCSGKAVGLPDGYMGNSEVGHLNIGAGRVVYQDMTRIDIAIDDDTFTENAELQKTINAVKKTGGTLHLMGLLSDGGVHSHIRHIQALVAMAHAASVPVLVHAFMDGRDTAPTSGAGFMDQLIASLPAETSVATVSGRFYAMDRDKRWDRVAKTWDAIVHAQGGQAPSAREAIDKAYAAATTDEFITPTIIGSYAGMQDGDGVIFANFRADRMRQLAHAFCDETFDAFQRGRMPHLSALTGMTRYEKALSMPAAFAPQLMTLGLGEVVSRAGLAQIRIAETEKYAHVTYFFNGGVETPFPQEERTLVPSPRDVPTYDLKPQMSARKVADSLLQSLNTDRYALIVCNLANMDMVGHTGNIPATITACETVDACLGDIHCAVKKMGGILLVTADHGNAEEMLTPEGFPQTSHSKNPVALLVCDYRGGPPLKLKKQGRLADIAPTILHLMHLPIPPEMTGTVLCEEV